MTDTVADLVLRNNYLQTLSLSVTGRHASEDMPHQERLMQNLESRNLLDRAVEDLPDDLALQERRAAGQVLTRSETGVLLAYAKIVALDDLVASDVPDDPYFSDLLTDYFPPKMQKTYRQDIEGHRLRREIIGTVLANSMINRGGATFINRVTDRTGAPLDTIARAYAAVRDVFDMTTLNAQIDALDAKISGDLQLELYSIVRDRVLSQTVWFVRYGDFSKGMEKELADYRKAISVLSPKLLKVVPDFLAQRISTDQVRYKADGVPNDLATKMALLPFAGLIPDIVFASRQSNSTLDRTATVFFTATEFFRVGRMVQASREIETVDYYDGLALDRALQSLHRARRDIVVDIMRQKGKNSGNFDAWYDSNRTDVDRTLQQLDGIIANEQATVSRLTVAANVLADLARK